MAKQYWRTRRDEVYQQQLDEHLRAKDVRRSDILPAFGVAVKRAGSPRRPTQELMHVQQPHAPAEKGQLQPGSDHRGGSAPAARPLTDGAQHPSCALRRGSLVPTVTASAPNRTPPITAQCPSPRMTPVRPIS